MRIMELAELAVWIGISIFIFFILYHSIKKEFPEFMEMFKLPALAQKPAFQNGETRYLKAEIDGKEKDLKVRTLNDFFQQTMSMNSKIIVYLDDDWKGGRKLEMETTSSGGDDYIRITHSNGGSVLAEEKLNLDKNPVALFEFVADTLKDTSAQIYDNRFR